MQDKDIRPIFTQINLKCSCSFYVKNNHEKHNKIKQHHQEIEHRVQITLRVCFIIHVWKRTYSFWDRFSKLNFGWNSTF